MLVERGPVVPVGGALLLGAEEARKCNFGFSARGEEEVVLLIVMVMYVMVRGRGRCEG